MRKRLQSSKSAKHVPADDAELLLCAAVKDTASFRDFYLLTVEGVALFFNNRVLEPELANDLTAETYAALLCGLRRWDPSRGSAMQYLYGIANNQYLMWRRRGEVSRKYQHRVGIRLTPIETAVEDDVIERLDQVVMRKRLTVAMADLKPRDREAVQLRVIDGLSYEEVARQLSCNEGAARVRVSRALARLHDSVNDEKAGQG